jgi:hypothetical protein
MGQAGEGPIDVMKYEKFQSLLMNRHTKCEDIVKKIDTWGEEIEFSCLKCGGKPKSRIIVHYFYGLLAMTRTNEQK